MKADFCDSISECAKTYKAEAWEQFMMLAAAWLHCATKLPTYVEVWSFAASAQPAHTEAVGARTYVTGTRTLMAIASAAARMVT
jgi:hypothetical protein